MPSVTAPPAGAEVTDLDVDVCVVGGGAAGMAAATCAARGGVRVALLEESSVLGGNITRGLVNLDKIAYGGPPMVAGYFQELIQSLAADGAAIYPSEETGWATPFEPDALRARAREMAQKEGVLVRFGCQAAWADREGRTLSAVWAGAQGSLVRVRARHYIDCTGDGHLGFMAGHGYWLGDRNHGQVQGQTLIFYVAPVDFARISEHARNDGQSQVTPYQVIGMRAFMAAFRRKKVGRGSPQQGLLMNRNMDPNMVSISASEVYGNHLEPGGLTDIMAILEEQNQLLHAELEAQIPGFADSRIVRMGERPYLREGRRLMGHYQLTADDVMQARQHDDDVARGWYPIDLHVAYAGGPVHVGQVPAGKWYGIPYRSLVARDLDNLLMAGRCLSATHEALGSVRITPTSMATGQAAGIAAAMAAQAGIPALEVPADELRAEIQRQGGMV